MCIYRPAKSMTRCCGFGMSVKCVAWTEGNQLTCSALQDRA